MSAPRILLNAIVKNETANLPRMLNSVLGHITAAVIVDTGSTDGTPELLKEFFTKHKIPHRVASTVFVNFEQARNFALQRARVAPFAYDYILLLDADMELVVKGPLPSLTAESYTLLQRQGGMAYYNVRLLRKNSKALYHGVTHEYVDVGDQAQLPDDVWEFTDHATGSTRGRNMSATHAFSKAILLSILMMLAAYSTWLKPSVMQAGLRRLLSITRCGSRLAVGRKKFGTPACRLRGVIGRWGTRHRL